MFEDSVNSFALTSLKTLYNKINGNTKTIANFIIFEDFFIFELRISFAKPAAVFAPIVINGEAIEVVSTVKLLGLNISSDLRWNCHVAEISKKKRVEYIFLDN